MSLIEIIVIGYVVNVVLSFVNYKITFNFVMGSMSKSIKIKKIVKLIYEKLNNLDIIREQLKSQDKLIYTQENFILLIPYSVILETFLLIYNIYNNTLYEHILKRTQNIEDKLMSRL